MASGQSGRVIGILLVEEDDTIAAHLHTMLEQIRPFQCAVTRVRTLRQTVQQLVEKPHDLVLLDLLLPDSQGMRTLDRLHEEAPGVPIVVLTRFGYKDLDREVIRKGAQGFLRPRQANPEALVQMIRLAIARKQFEPLPAEEEGQLRPVLRAAKSG